ncbi:hypothetical protein Lalb_Chr11g0062401 [Lupinus albus]|uniref:Uncharacterized protein n=1 Tax=Lupinus albus TaxID=3870 RepID=A0A6A4PQ04_LUPAL|nr:hypothetical protein Lalb_Chr11g0062401 [Lupinus albus]
MFVHTNNKCFVHSCFFLSFHCLVLFFQVYYLVCANFFLSHQMCNFNINGHITFTLVYTLIIYYLWSVIFIYH